MLWRRSHDIYTNPYYRQMYIDFSIVETGTKTPKKQSWGRGPCYSVCHPRALPVSRDTELQIELEKRATATL